MPPKPVSVAQPVSSGKKRKNERKAAARHRVKSVKAAALAAPNALDHFKIEAAMSDAIEESDDDDDIPAGNLFPSSMSV